MNENEIERALKQLRGPMPPKDDDDEIFVAQVRKRYEARKQHRRWRLPLVTLALAAAAAFLALVGPRPVITNLPAPSHLADDADYLDEDPCELIGELDHDEVLRVSAQYKNGV